MAYILPEAANIAKVTPPRVLSNAGYEIPARYRNAFYLANASFYDTVNWYIHRAYEVIYPTLKHNLKQIEPKKTDVQCDETVSGIIAVLEQCNSIIDVRFPIRRRDGKLEVVRGFRAQHGMSSGYETTLGGFRMGEQITRDHMKGLSALATFRNACMGIGMSGAHGGLKINSMAYTEDELQHILEEYANALINKGYCNCHDIMQPDMNSSSREMSWIIRALAKYTDSCQLAASGKCVDAGGIDGYNHTASQGVQLSLSCILNNEDLMKKCELKPGLAEKTFIIQGLGKVGAPLAELLVQKGAICVGVKDIDAHLYDPKGIDLQKLYEHKRKTGSIQGYTMTKSETNDAVYKERADILIFAAQQKSLTCYIAEDVKAKVIVEAADGPVTPSSHKILTGKSRLVVPDIYACSGATVASYLEYLSNLQRMGKLDQQILKQSNDIYGMALKQSQQAVAVGSGSTAVCEPFVTKSAVVDTMECVINDVGKEIFKYMDLLRLGTDIRTSAYIVGINKIFENVYKQKKLI